MTDTHVDKVELPTPRTDAGTRPGEHDDLYAAKMGDLLVDSAWETCVGQCVSFVCYLDGTPADKQCERLYISRERFDQHIAPYLRELANLRHRLNCIAQFDRESIALAEERGRLSTQSASERPLTLDNERQVFFYEQDHYYLSNFSAFKVVWGGQHFDTSEHAYQWAKFPHLPELADSIRYAESAHDAFKRAEANSGRVATRWPLVKVDVMRDILRAKASQHEYVRRKLLQTGDRELIENSWRDAYWGWGPNRDGQNMLGKLWMQVRAELRAENATDATTDRNIDHG